MCGPPSWTSPLSRRSTASGAPPATGSSGTINIALRHPQLFGRVVALSGRYDLTRPVEDFRDLFDGYYDEDIYFNTPNHYLPNVHEAKQLAALRQLDIKFVVGENDPFLDDNRSLSEVLQRKNIPHLFRLWSGRAHGYRRWREMVGWFI